MAWRLWLQSEQGRLALQVSALAASFTSFATYYVPQTILLEKYQEFVQSYSKGLGTPVSPNVKKLYEKVLSDLKVPENDKPLLQIFTVYGFDLFHAGTTSIRSGAIIGIPANFSYDTEDDVDRRIKAVTKSIDWESDAGRKLRSSLVLSDDAKKFGIAREVSASSGISVWLYSLYPSFAVLVSYMTARSLNDKLRLRNQPFRFIMYGLVGLFNLAAYFAATDLTTAYLESSADEEAAALGPAYAAGGVEFYTKLRERNKALRDLMGDAGAKLYTTSGNDVIFLRMKNTPISERLLALQQLLNNESPPVQGIQ